MMIKWWINNWVTQGGAQYDARFGPGILEFCAQTYIDTLIVFQAPQDLLQSSAADPLPCETEGKGRSRQGGILNVFLYPDQG